MSAPHHEWRSTEDVEDTALPDISISDLAHNVTLDSENISYFLMLVHIFSHLIYVTIFWPLGCSLPWSRVANTIAWDIGWTRMIAASCYQSNVIKSGGAFTCMQSFCSETKYLLVFVSLTSFTCCLCNYGVKTWTVASCDCSALAVVSPCEHYYKCSFSACWFEPRPSPSCSPAMSLSPHAEDAVTFHLMEWYRMSSILRRCSWV